MPTQLAVTPVYRGDPLTVTIQFPGVDLTPYGPTWAADIRTSIDDSQPAVSFTIDATNAATGTLVLSLTGTQTAGLRRTRDHGGTVNYGFDVQGTTAAGNNTTICKGSLAVDGEWTHT